MPPLARTPAVLGIAPCGPTPQHLDVRSAPIVHEDLVVKDTSGSSLPLASSLARQKAKNEMYNFPNP